MHPLNLLPLALAATATPLLPRAAAVTTADITAFTLFSQYSGAAYCLSNLTALNTPLACPSNICPIVTANRATLSAALDDNNPTNIDGILALDPSSNTLVLSIRGSASIRNWIANILFATTPCPAGMFASTANCGIHTGFALAWTSISNAMLPAIKAQLAASPARKLVIAGHSLGGAVATVAAAYLRGLEKIPCDVFTYGSPRTGNDGFASGYDTLSSSTSSTGKMGRDFRVTHAGDPVPRLPPLIAGFRHVGVEYWIKTEILNRIPGVSDIKVCEGTANVGCNGGSLDFSTDAHQAYFGNISGCGPDGGLKWRRDMEGLDEGTRNRLEVLAELDREFAGNLGAAKP